ncbi:MAG: efflux RND transporter periplasmic adaptor subunit, partial [Pyrinomonadaceae bacterium]
RLNQAKAQALQAQRELKRAENLAKIGAVPQKRLEEAQTEAKIAEQEVASTEKQVALLEEQIKQAETGQRIFSSPKVNEPKRIFPLLSPIKGVIDDVKVANGQIVEAGKEILSVIDTSEMLLEAQVFEGDLPILRKVGRASFTAPSLEGEVYEIGNEDLVFIGQTVNQQTRMVTVVYKVKNPRGALRDGMFVEISIQSDEAQSQLAVPKRAIFNEQGQNFVFVFKGGETFEKRPILLGSEDLQYAEVKSGLQKGERVVVEGIYQLRSIKQ